MPEADRSNYLAQVWLTQEETEGQKGEGLGQGHTAKQRFKPMLTTISFAFWQIYGQCQAQRHHYNGRGWWFTPVWDATVSGQGLGSQEAPTSLSVSSGSSLFQNNVIFSFYWVKNLSPLKKKKILVLFCSRIYLPPWMNTCFRVSVFKANSVSLFKVLVVAPLIQRASYKCQLLMTLQFS